MAVAIRKENPELRFSLFFNRPATFERSARTVLHRARRADADSKELQERLQMPWSALSEQTGMMQKM
jgi:hypothetical protein